MHVLTQFVDEFKLHLAVEESRIRSLKHLVRSLRADEGADYDEQEQTTAGDEDHDPDHSRDEAGAGDAGSRNATPENPESVFSRIHRPVTPEPSFEFLHGLGRYEEKRRQLQAERRKDYQTHLEQQLDSGSSLSLLQHPSRPPLQRPLLHHETSPKSFAFTSLQQKRQEQNEASGDQVTRTMSEKRLKHEKYRQELQKQIEEKKFLNDQEQRRLQNEDHRLEIRLQRDRGTLRREYETEMANIRLRSRSQPDLRQTAIPEAETRKVRSPSYVFVNKRPTAARPPRVGVQTRLRFGDKMPQSASTSTQTGDSLLEEIQTPKPEPHPRLSKAYSKLSKGSQMRIVQVKQRLKENQEMLLNLASAKHNNNGRT